MTEVSAQDEPNEKELSPRERQLMFLALRSLSTSLKVIADSQRAVLARLDANHEAHERDREHHARTMKILREALEIDRSAPRSVDERVGNGSKAIAVAVPGARVSGRALRKRGRSRSAAG